MTTYEALGSITYRHLKQMIFNGDLEFNTIYSEAKIAADLNISRTPVRDSLMRLSQERYIDILPSKGFRLHKPNEADLLSARHYRLAIEGYCAALIAENLQDEENIKLILEMENILLLQRGVADETHIKRFWRLDTEFHTMMVSRLQNPYFDSLYANCNYLFTSLPVKNFFVEGRHITTLEDHRRIIDALKSGSPEAARRAVTAHVDESLRIIVQESEKT